jgi:hypothetical protein
MIRQVMVLACCGCLHALPQTECYAGHTSYHTMPRHHLAVLKHHIPVPSHSMTAPQHRMQKQLNRACTLPSYQLLGGPTVALAGKRLNCVGPLSLSGINLLNPELAVLLSICEHLNPSPTWWSSQHKKTLTCWISQTSQQAWHRGRTHGDSQPCPYLTHQVRSCLPFPSSGGAGGMKQELAQFVFCQAGCCVHSGCLHVRRPAQYVGIPYSPALPVRCLQQE